MRILFSFMSDFTSFIYYLHAYHALSNEVQDFLHSISYDRFGKIQGGKTCGAIDEPRKSSKAIDKRVIIDFRDKNVVIERFRDPNEVFI